MTNRQRLIKSVAYYRRSTKKQDASIEDQRAAVESYAKVNEYRIVAEYVDDGISGDDTANRTAFLDMRADAENGGFEAVLCWDQDRFGRFDSLEAGHWCYPFRQAGVSIVTVNDGLIDWNDFTGRMMYGMKQEAKHQFLRDLSRNVMRGIVEAAKNGSWHGTPPYGYKIVGKSKAKRLKVDPVNATVVERIFREYVCDGRAMNAIAKRLTEDGVATPRNGKRWLQSTIRVILQNPAYVGTFRFNAYSSSKYHIYRDGEIVKGGHRGQNDPRHWIVIKNMHEPIVDKQSFDKAQKLLGGGKGKRSNYAPEENPYLFSGILRCGICGANMHGEKNYCNGRRFYECGRRDDDVTSCTGTKVYQDELIQYLADDIDDTLGKDLLRRVAGMKNGQRTRIMRVPVDVMKKLTELLMPAQRKRIDKARQMKKVDSLTKKIDRARKNLIHLNGAKNISAAEQEIDRMEQTVDELRASLAAEPTKREVEDSARDLIKKLAALETGDPDTIRRVLREVDHIVIHSKRKGKHANGLRYHFQRGEIYFAQVGARHSKPNSHRSV